MALFALGCSLMKRRGTREIWNNASWVQHHRCSGAGQRAVGAHQELIRWPTRSSPGAARVLAPRSSGAARC